MNSSGTTRGKTYFVAGTTTNDDAPVPDAFMTVSSAGIICPRRTEHPLNFITFPSASPVLQQKPRWLSPRLPVPKASHSAKKLAKSGIFSGPSLLNGTNNNKNKTSSAHRPSSNSYNIANPILQPKRRAQTTKDKSSMLSSSSNKSMFPSRSVNTSKRKSFVAASAGQKQKDTGSKNTKTEIISRSRQGPFDPPDQYEDSQNRSKLPFPRHTTTLGQESGDGNTGANGHGGPSKDFTLKAVLATSKSSASVLSERFQVIRSDEERERNPECIRLDRCALKHFPLIGNASTKDKEAANLRLVSLQHNLITRLENLPSLNHLVVLDLYDNRVERITGLQGLCSLRVLLLGKNRIRRIEGLDGLKRLEVLDLHGNQLRYVDNLGALSSLRVLNLAGNLLRNIRNLGPYGLSSLSELNLRRNRIRNLDGLQKAPHLKKLLLANNDLQSLSSLYSLRKLVFLQELLLEPNPLCSVPDYRSQVLTVFPWLELLDRCSVTDQMRLDAKIWHRRRIAEDEDKRKEHSRLRTAPGSREQIIYQARQRWESVKNFVKNSNSASIKEPLSLASTLQPPTLQKVEDIQCKHSQEEQHFPERGNIEKQGVKEEGVEEQDCLLAEYNQEAVHEEDTTRTEVERFQFLYDQDTLLLVDEYGNEQQGACGNNSDSTNTDHHHAQPISFNTFACSDTTTTPHMIDDPPTGIRVNSNRNDRGGCTSGGYPPTELHSSRTTTSASNSNVTTQGQHNSVGYTNINMINSVGSGRSRQNDNHSSADQQQIDPLSSPISSDQQRKHNQHPSSSSSAQTSDKDKGTKIAVVRPLVRDVHFNENEVEGSEQTQHPTNSDELELHDNDDGGGLTGSSKQSDTLQFQVSGKPEPISLSSAPGCSGISDAAIGLACGKKEEVEEEGKGGDDGDQVAGRLTKLEEVRNEKKGEEINANVMGNFGRDTTGKLAEKISTGTGIAEERDREGERGICSRRNDRLLRRSASTCLLPVGDVGACGQETVASLTSCPTSAGAAKTLAGSNSNKDKLSFLRNLRSASFDVRFPSSDSDSSDDTCSIATSNATSDLSPRRGLRKQLFPRSRPRLKFRSSGADRVNLRAQSSIVTMGRRQGVTLPGASRYDSGKGNGKTGTSIVRRCDSAAVRETSPPTPMRKQGTDYLVEIDGKILSIYGQGALKHTLMGFPASVTCNVTTAKFHYISYDSIIPYFGKLRQIYPSLEHFQFRANNLGSLAQLNALADLQGLTSLHIAKEGNVVVQHELWPHYATYRLSHWGLQNVNGKEVSSEYRGGTLSSQAKGFESLGYVALSCLPQTALTPLAKRLHMLHCFCCCSPSSSSDDSGRRKATGPNGSPSESSGNICTSWDDDPVLLDVIGKEALVYTPPLPEKEEEGKDGNGGSNSGRTETLHKIINSGCEILEKLDMLEKVWPSLMTEVIQDILMDYLFMDNYMKKELKKLQDTALLSKKTSHL